VAAAARDSSASGGGGARRPRPGCKTPVRPCVGAAHYEVVIKTRPVRAPPALAVRWTRWTERAAMQNGCSCARPTRVQSANELAFTNGRARARAE
jgi:hypothetical protein